MTISEMHTALKLELDKSDSLNNLSFEPEELDYWLNKAIKRFVKTRYSGSNYKAESFEETQKRTDDLRTLVEVIILPTTEDYPFIENSFYASIPADYYFALSEDCQIVFNPYHENYLNAISSGDLQEGYYYMVMIDDITHNAIDYSPGEIFLAENEFYTPTVEPGEDDDHPYVILLDKKIQGVTQIDSDTYREHIENPYSEHRLHYGSAKPLRLFRNETGSSVVVLITDGNYFITRYYLTYLREPEIVDFSASEDCDLPEHTHDEIIDLAALMLIENIESNRIQTNAAMSINE